MLTPVIRTLSEKKLIGTSISTNLIDNKTFELWKNFMPRRKEITNNVDANFISMQLYKDAAYFRDFSPQVMFEKWATVEVSDFNSIPAGMNSFVLPGGLYAVFHYIGAASAAAPTFQYIFGTWLPNSEYELDHRPHFEILGEKYKNGDPTSEEEIWIPIKKK